MDLAEIERENILAQRQEEMQRILDKRNLDLMLKERTGGGEESVARAAKRVLLSFLCTGHVIDK